MSIKLYNEDLWPKIVNAVSVEELIHNYIRGNNPSTINISNGKMCSHYRRRSISDLKYLCAYYLKKDVHVDEVIRAIYTFVTECENETLQLRHCTEINKVVVRLVCINIKESTACGAMKLTDCIYLWDPVLIDIKLRTDPECPTLTYVLAKLEEFKNESIPANP